MSPLYVRGVDTREWDEDAIKSANRTPPKGKGKGGSSSSSFLEKLIPGSKEKRKARHKYLESDPDSHPHIDGGVSGGTGD